MANKQTEKIRFRIEAKPKEQHDIISCKRIKTLKGGKLKTEDDILEEHFDYNMWSISNDEDVKMEPQRKKQKTISTDENMDTTEPTETKAVPNKTDPRFDHFEDPWKDAKPALSINLHDEGFSFDNQQGVHYHYDSNTRGLIKCIDSRRLPPDLVELLDGIPNVYYEGCMIVEIRDYRNSSPQGKPSIKRVVLKPDTESIINDIQQLSSRSVKRWNADDFIAAEEKIMQATLPTICLDPSIDVARNAIMTYYNHLKFNIKPRERVSLLPTPIVEEPLEETKPKISLGSTTSLLTFLKQREKQTSEEIPNEFAAQVHQIVNKVINSQSSPAPPKSFDLPANPMAQLFNRKLKFHAQGGKIFIYFQVYLKRTGGYEGMMRVGSAPDTQNGDIIRFSMGNAEEAIRFINQLKTLYEKEGIAILVQDTAGLKRLHNIFNLKDPVLSNMAQVVAQEVARNPPQAMSSRKEGESIFPYAPPNQIAQMNIALGVQQAQLIQGALIKKRGIPTNPIQSNKAARATRGLEGNPQMPIPPTLPFGVPPEQRRPPTDLIGFWSRMQGQNGNQTPTATQPQLENNHH